MAGELKSKSVQTVTSDEENVRLRIYEGDIPIGDAGAELLRLALAEHRRNAAVLREMQRQGALLGAVVDQLLEPWPVRWWRYFVRG